MPQPLENYVSVIRKLHQTARWQSSTGLEDSPLAKRSSSAGIAGLAVDVGLRC
jgi:hypothetical protein